jgi:hypothetical protein
LGDLVFTAMGFPAEGAESAWRNDINEVARFFKTYHKDHFLILNLSEKSYDISKFDNRVRPQYSGRVKHTNQLTNNKKDTHIKESNNLTTIFNV